MKIMLMLGKEEGGFWALTRTMRDELMDMGHKVEVTFANKFFYKFKPRGLFNRVGLLREMKAHLKKFKNYDIFFNTIGDPYYTWISKQANPKSKHFIWLQDPRDVEDWKRINSLPQIDNQHKNEMDLFGQPKEIYHFPNRIAIDLDNKYMKKSLEVADEVFTQAIYLKDKVNKMINGNFDMTWLPNPVTVPKTNYRRKSETPSSLFVARLSLIKRPYIYCKLAFRMTKHQFNVLGDSGMKDTLQNRFTRKNLNFKGYVAGIKKMNEYNRAWFLINTSIHECLPVTFLEAWAHRCAVISFMNPDNLVEKFGMVTSPDVENFRDSIEEMSDSNLWKKFATAGYRYVRSNHRKQKVLKTFKRYLK